MRYKPGPSAWETYGGQINEMRQEGETLQDIGEKVGRSRERIRQILVQHYGSPKVTRYITTDELAKRSHTYTDFIRKIEKQGLIAPVNPGRPPWTIKYWDPNLVPIVMKARVDQHLRCEICGIPIWLGKRCKEHQFVELTCSECGKKFKMSRHLFNSRTKRGYKHFFCTQICLGKHAGREYGFAKTRQKYDYEIIWSLARAGRTGTEISEILGAPRGSIYSVLKKKNLNYQAIKHKKSDNIAILKVKESKDG